MKLKALLLLALACIDCVPARANVAVIAATVAAGNAMRITQQAAATQNRRASQQLAYTYSQQNEERIRLHNAQVEHAMQLANAAATLTDQQRIEGRTVVPAPTGSRPRPSFQGDIQAIPVNKKPVITRKPLTVLPTGKKAN